MKQLQFNHKLYGKCFMVPNKSFIPSVNITAFDYIMDNSMIVRQSGFADAKFFPTREQLVDFGYIPA